MDEEWKSPWGVLNSALADAYSVLKKSLALYAGLALAGLLVDVFLTPLHPFFYYGRQLLATNIMLTVAFYFALANAVRTLAPRYRMTVVDLLAVIGLAVLLIVGVAVGSALLIVPGIFVLARFGPIAYVYLIGRAVGADGGLFGRTFDATAHRGWQTLAVFLVVAIFQLTLGKLFESVGVPATGITALAIMDLLYFAACLWIGQVASLALLRWVAVREPRLVGGTDENVPVPAAP